MQGWVDLGGWLELVTPHNGHPSRTNRARCWLTSLMRRTTLTTTPSRRPCNFRLASFFGILMPARASVCLSVWESTESVFQLCISWKNGDILVVKHNYFLPDPHNTDDIEKVKGQGQLYYSAINSCEFTITALNWERGPFSFVLYKWELNF